MLLTNLLSCYSDDNIPKLTSPLDLCLRLLMCHKHFELLHTSNTLCELSLSELQVLVEEKDYLKLRLEVAISWSKTVERKWLLTFARQIHRNYLEILTGQK